MSITATKLTAALAGPWTVLGMSMYSHWSEHQTLDVTSHNLAFLLAGTLFMLVPYIVFVAGIASIRTEFRDLSMNRTSFLALFINRHGNDVGPVWTRMVYWFAGAAISAIVIWPFVDYLYAN